MDLVPVVKILRFYRKRINRFCPRFVLYEIAQNMCQTFQLYDGICINRPKHVSDISALRWHMYINRPKHVSDISALRWHMYINRPKHVSDISALRWHMYINRPKHVSDISALRWHIRHLYNVAQNMCQTFQLYDGICI